MGKWKEEALIVLEMGGGVSRRIEGFILNLSCLQNNRFPSCSQNKNHLDCPLNVWHETLTFSYLIQCCKAIWDNVFLCFPEVAY